MHLIICSASVLSIEFKFHVKHNLYMHVIDIWKFSFQWYYISFDASKWSIKTRPQLPYISFVSLSIWLSLYPFDVIMSGRILLILTKCHRYQIPFMCAIWCLWHYRAQKSYHLWSSCYCWLDPVIDLTWITINELPPRPYIAQSVDNNKSQKKTAWQWLLSYSMLYR